MHSFEDVEKACVIREFEKFGFNVTTLRDIAERWDRGFGLLEKEEVFVYTQGSFPADPNESLSSFVRGDFFGEAGAFIYRPELQSRRVTVWDDCPKEGFVHISRLVLGPKS